MTLTILEEQLKEKNDDIFGVYLKIKDGMSILLKNYEISKNLNPWDSVVDYYTLHGYTHCENVLKKLDYLLDKSNLNSYELFYILSAVWLHDIGMIEHPYGDDTLKAREEHHNSSVVYFEKTFAPTYLEGESLPGRFRLTTKDKQAIRSIIEYHRRKEKIKEVEEYFDRDGKDNRVFLRFLAAVFRIADGLDLDNTRAPFFIYERNKESMPYLSKVFWNQHFPITSIVPNMDKGGLIEIRFSRSKSPEGCIHKRDMVSILLQVSRDIKSEIESVDGETSPSYLDFPESYKFALSDTRFIDDEKKANDPERIFRPKEEEEPSGWSIRENVGWGPPYEIKDKLKTGELTNYSEFQSCFVNTSKTQEFLDLVSKEYAKQYYLISPANTGKSTLLNVASWAIFKNMNGIRSYVIRIDKKIPTYDELIEHLRKYYYVEDENFICIFDRMEHIPSNIPDPEPLKELIRSLRNNHHVVWGAGRTWEEFQFTEIWKKFVVENFEIHKLPELLKGTDIEKFRPKFEDFFSDEKELSKFWKLVLEEDEIETDSLSQIYVALQGKEMKLTDEEVKSIVKDNLKRTSSRYDKIYRTLNSWEYNIYCLAYMFHGIFKDIANNIISVFENEEMDYIDQMAKEGKIEIGLHPLMKKEERLLGLTGIHLNDESRRILEKDRTYDSIVNTCSSLLRTFFETDSEKACSSIPFFFSTRTVMSKTLLKAFVELVLRCRDEFMNFYILSYLARENPSLTEYWKELVQQKDNAPNEWLFGEVVINFGIAIAQSGENKAENKAFSDIVDLVPNGGQLHNLGVDLNNLKMFDYALVAYDKAIELDPKFAYPWYGKGNALSELEKKEEAIKACDKAIELDPKFAAPWNGRGNALSELGKKEEAIKAYDKAIELDPKDAYPWHGRGNALSELGKKEEAIKAYDKAIELDPKFAAPWNGRGNALSELGKKEEAIKAYDKAIELDPKFAHPWHGRGNALSELGEKEEAIKAYDKAIELDPKDAAPWHGRGNALSELGEKEEAIKAYDKAIELDPKFAHPWHGRGNALRELGEKEEAIKAYDKAIELDPKFAYPWNGRGNALRELGEREEAIKAYDKAIELDPKFAAPWNGRGNALRESRKKEEAIKAYDKAIELDPKFAAPWDGRGNALSELGKKEEAIKAYDKAIELDPKDAYPWNGKGIALSELGKKEEAIKAYDKAIELDLKFAAPWNGRGNALGESGKKEEAIKAYDKAIELDPKFAYPWYGKGYVLSELGKKEEAIKAYDKAIELDPKFAAPWDGRGNALSELGKKEEAIKAYDKAIELDPKYAYPWHGKGYVLSESGKKEEAIKAYDKAIELDPKYAYPWNGRGNALSELGEKEEAIKAYDKAIELDPKFAYPWHGRGNALRELGEREEAIKAYDKAIELDPKFAAPWHGKGAALSELGKKEEAIKAYDKAIELDPKFAYPWHGRGNALSELGEKEEAIKAYDKAIELDPKYAYPWYGKGYVLRELGKKEEAIKACDKAIELDPKFAYPWNGKGYVLSELGKKEEAIKAYDKAIELDPKFAHPWNGRGNALSELGKKEEAIKAYDKAIELDPKDAHPWNGKGAALSELGEKEEAIKAYDKAIELDPKYAYPWHGRGNALSELGEKEEAIKAYDKAIELDPKFAAPWYGKGILFWRNNKMEKAKQTFEEAIELFPKNLSLRSNYSELLIALGKFGDARKSIEKTIELCSSQEERQDMEVMRITLIMIIEGYEKARKFVHSFIKDFTLQNSHWDYSDIAPALSSLSELDRKRIEAIQKLNLGRCSVDNVKALWDL